MATIAPISNLEMKEKRNFKALIFEQKVILGLSIPLITLLIACSATGLLHPEIYKSASPNWMTQTIVQDGINLFLIAPILFVASLHSFQGVKFAFLMWGGTVCYLVYTFLIYCFSVPFNFLFLGYCAILSLSIFSLGWFFMTQVRKPVVTRLHSKLFLRTAGIYFLAIACIFLALWLFEIVPASLSGIAPKTLAETGLMTNPVQVIDLSIFLPFVFMSGIAAIRTKAFSSILIPVILMFFVLMDITIAAIAVVLFQNGFGRSWTLVLLMGILAIFSLALLVIFVVNSRRELSD